MEILAPVGSPAMLEAALVAGADAVYLGAGHFHARSERAGFSLDTLSDCLAEAHRQGAKVYLTLNILLYDQELGEAINLAAQAYEAGIDALIIQDLGLMRLLRRLLPDLPLHASTQMGIGTYEGLARLAEAGVGRVILPRECSLEEVGRLTAEAQKLGLETEVFVHGAQCVCYSGHCGLSHSLGGRSANRGACAQPCRLPYRLSTSAEGAEPLLSPKDMSSLKYLPELQAMGVASCKIEGRMRSPEYVYTVVRQMRSRLSRETPDPVAPAAAHHQLLQAYNRGGAFSAHRIECQRGPDWMSGPVSGHLGVRLGVVETVDAHKGRFAFRIEPEGAAVLETLPLQKGDVLVLRSPQGEEKAVAPIAQPEPSRQGWWIWGFHPELLTKIRRGDLVYRSRSEAQSLDLKTALRQGLSEEARLPLDLCFQQANPTAPLMLQATDGPFQVSLNAPATPETLPLSADRLEQQLAKLGGSPYRLASLRFEGLDPRAGVPLRIADVNALRRETVARLQAMRTQATRRPLPAHLKAEAEALLSPPLEARVPTPPAFPSRLIHLPAWRPSDRLPTILGAEAFLLPYAALEALETEGQLAPLLAEHRIFVVLPPGAPLAFYERAREALPRWAKLGLGGQLSSGPTAIAPDQLPWGLLADANVSNREALAWYQEQGVVGLLLAQEVSESPDATQALMATCQSLGLVCFEGHGAKLSMTFLHCPLGHGLKGCQRCAHTPSVSLLDARGRAHPFVPLRYQACSGQLFAPQGEDQGGFLEEDLHLDWAGASPSRPRLYTLLPKPRPAVPEAAPTSTSARSPSPTTKPRPRRRPLRRHVK